MISNWHWGRPMRFLTRWIKKQVSVFKKSVFLSSLMLCWACFQLEQFNMIENPISSTSLYNHCSTLNYTQAAMMGLTGSSLQDSQQLSYSNHSNIPNIILTGNTIIGFRITCMQLCTLNGSSEAFRGTVAVGRFCPLMEAVAGKKKVKASAKMKGMVESPQFSVLPSCESFWGCFSTLTEHEFQVIESQLFSPKARWEHNRCILDVFWVFIQTTFRGDLDQLWRHLMVRTHMWSGPHSRRLLSFSLTFKQMAGNRV